MGLICGVAHFMACGLRSYTFSRPAALWQCSPTTLAPPHASIDPRLGQSTSAKRPPTQPLTAMRASNDEYTTLHWLLFLSSLAATSPVINAYLATQIMPTPSRYWNPLKYTVTKSLSVSGNASLAALAALATRGLIGFLLVDLVVRAICVGRGSIDEDRALRGWLSSALAVLGARFAAWLASTTSSRFLSLAAGLIGGLLAGSGMRTIL